MSSLPVSAGPILLLGLSALVLVVLMILHWRRDSRPRIRSLSAFQDLQDEMGRAAESGRPIHVALGGGELNGENAMASLAGLQVMEALVDAAVAYDVPPIITVGDPTLLPLAQDILRRAYERQQLMELYDPGQVRFVAPAPVAYAAGALNVGVPEEVAATMAAGTFGSEVSLMADAGVRRDAPQLAAVDAPSAVGALYPAIDRLAVGEELYAAGARMTEGRGYLTGLVAQDILRFILVLAILGAAVLAFLGV